MGNERNKCDICEEDYTCSVEKKPVMITLCGHTYCRSCLCHLEEAGTKVCPSCRVDWNQLKAQELPVCFQLLPEEDLKKIKAEDERRKREEELLTLKHKMETEEENLSTRRQSTKIVLDDVNERISSVREFMESTSSYLTSLEEYQSELTDLKISLDQKLQQLQNDLRALSEPETELGSRNDIIQVERTETFKLEIRKVPVSRIWTVIKAFQISRSDADEASFVNSFYNNLKEQCAKLENERCPGSPLVSCTFLDNKDWEVCDSTAGSEAIRLISETSVRPRTVKIFVDKLWDAVNITSFFSAISSTARTLELSINDIFTFPSSGNLAVCQQRLQSLLLDPSNRRCTVTEYVGGIDRGVAQKLAPLSLRKVTVNVTSDEEMVAAGETGARAVELHIKEGTKNSVLSKLPTEGRYSLYIFGRTDEDLLEMIPALTNDNKAIINPIRLLDSRITEAGIDRFLGRLRDINVIPLQKPSSPLVQQPLKCRAYGRESRKEPEKNFHIQSHAIDAAGQRRITERLKSWGKEFFITWK